MRLSAYFTASNVIMIFLVFNFITLGILIGQINYHFQQVAMLDEAITKQHEKDLLRMLNHTREDAFVRDMAKNITRLEAELLNKTS